MVDDKGRIRTLVAVPDEQWREAIAKDEYGEYEILDDDAYYDTVIEVIDPMPGSLILDAYRSVCPGLPVAERVPFPQRLRSRLRGTPWRVRVNSPQ